MQRRHTEDCGAPTLDALNSIAKAKGIPGSALIRGWDDGTVLITWWAEETPEEKQDRINREAQAEHNRKRRFG